MVPFPVPLTALSEVRSTLLLASVHALRVAGYLDAYQARLDPQHRDAVLAPSPDHGCPLAWHSPTTGRAMRSDSLPSSRWPWGARRATASVTI